MIVDVDFMWPTCADVKVVHRGAWVVICPLCGHVRPANAPPHYMVRPAFIAKDPA